MPSSGQSSRAGLVSFTLGSAAGPPDAGAEAGRTTSFGSPPSTRPLYDRMPDACGSGPAAILDLRDEGGLYPPDFLGVGQLVLEGRHVRAQRIELLKEILCLVRTESRPDMAGRDELASCVFAEHERADRVLGDRGRNEPGDDERAMLRAFDLEPAS